MLCKVCEAEYQDGAYICPNCGTPTPSTHEASPPSDVPKTKAKSWSVLAAIALLIVSASTAIAWYAVKDSGPHQQLETGIAQVTPDATPSLSPTPAPSPQTAETPVHMREALPDDVSIAPTDVSKPTPSVSENNQAMPSKTPSSTKGREIQAQSKPETELKHLPRQAAQTSPQPPTQTAQEASHAQKNSDSADPFAKCKNLSFIMKIACQEKIRWKICEGKWGKVPECPQPNHEYESPFTH